MIKALEMGRLVVMASSLGMARPVEMDSNIR
jgi:hypothetical protein